MQCFLSQFDGGTTFGGILGSVIGAVVIILFNVMYGKLAEFLNNWENHRTETEHQDALIFKTFLFQFVNTFASLYYIAFAKRATDFGQLVGSGSLQDKCKTAFMVSFCSLFVLCGASFVRSLSVHVSICLLVVCMCVRIGRARRVFAVDQQRVV